MDVIVWYCFLLGDNHIMKYHYDSFCLVFFSVKLLNIHLNVFFSVAKESIWKTILRLIRTISLHYQFFVTHLTDSWFNSVYAFLSQTLVLEKPDFITMELTNAYASLYTYDTQNIDLNNLCFQLAFIFVDTWKINPYISGTIPSKTLTVWLTWNVPDLTCYMCEFCITCIGQPLVKQVTYVCFKCSNDLNN